MVFGLEAEKVEEFLSSRGYCRIVNATSQDLQARYFTGVNAGREVAPVYGIVSAVVKP